MNQPNKSISAIATSTNPSSPALSAGASEAVPTPKSGGTEVKQAANKAPRRMVRFGLKVLNARHVCVVGTFNDWNPGIMSLKEFGSGNWFTYLSLEPGRYEYQFLVDGQRVDDPSGRDYVPNPKGGKNAIILVQ
jgi:1,4-alpha-glucan branching enzyme